MIILNFLKIIFFRLIYGRINLLKYSKKNQKNVLTKKIFLSKNISYNIYVLNKASSYQGSVHDNALIVENSVIDKPSYQYRFNSKKRIHNGKIRQNIIFKEGTAKFKKKINENVFLLLTGGAGKDNYFHWLFDVLPRFAIFEKSKIKYKKLKFILPSLKRNFQRETLKEMKIPEDKCLDGDNFKHFSAKKIIVTDHPYVKNNDPTNSIINIPDWIIYWLRNKFLNKRKKLKSKKFDKIYIDRSDSKFSKNRYIKNEFEIKKYLISSGFYPVVLSKVNFISQVKIFNKAKIIVGAHGAGFANIIFSKLGTKIIELQSPGSGNAIKNLAKKCKLKYYRITSNAIKRFSNPHGRIFININELKKKLKAR